MQNRINSIFNAIVSVLLVENWTLAGKLIRHSDVHDLLIVSVAAVFVEQYMMLNREDPPDDRPDSLIYPLDQAKVFLCTTVYREKPVIMEQYLRCLSCVYSSQRTYRTIETHIVVDDAFTIKGKLNTHAQSFISLCKDILTKNDVSTAQRTRTPYGGQILITFENGSFVYLHFKDKSKVISMLFGVVNASFKL